MWKILNSRNFAIYLLIFLLTLLAASTYLPSEITLSRSEWLALGQTRPLLFWLAARFSTPALVKGPLFLLTAFFLFLSTLVCTADRVLKRIKYRTSEFVTERAFSFAVAENVPGDAVGVAGMLQRLLVREKWLVGAIGTEGRAVITAQKGKSGFWGSVVFHGGLLLCFLAGPVTALTGFRGEALLLEGYAAPLRTSLASSTGKAPATLPDIRLRVHDLRGVYFKGKYKYDFGGVLALDDGTGERETPFAVNEPVTWQGYQFSLNQYGYAPRLVVADDRGALFDQYLNVSAIPENDYFEVGEGVRALVLFFPDFIREGGKIGTKTREPNNPVAMVKLYRGERELFKGLFKPGESAVWEGKRISVPDYRHWVSLVVTRESGVWFVSIGLLLVTAGLLARFLSNERRLEFELIPLDSGTRCTIRGYSRYYPAFLEREVGEMAAKLKSLPQSPASAGEK